MTSIVLAVSAQLWIKTKTIAQCRRTPSLLLCPVKYVEPWRSVCEMRILHFEMAIMTWNEGLFMLEMGHINTIIIIYQTFWLLNL